MISVRPTEPGDRPWMVRRLEDAFAGVTVARKGILIDASILPGFAASDGGRLVGLLTYAAPPGQCEVVAITSTEEGWGIGRGLMDAARDHAEASGYGRLWLITTKHVCTRIFLRNQSLFLIRRPRPVELRCAHTNGCPKS